MVRGEARGLGTGNPGREGTASREGKCISPSPGAGPGWIICCFKNLNTKRLSLSLGPKRAWRVMDGSTPDHTHPPSRQQATVGGSGESSKALLTHPLPNYGNQVSGPGPCIPPRCPTAGTSVVQLVPLVWCLGAGSCPAISLVPVDYLTRLCDSVCPASSQVQGHPPHSSEGS